MTHRFIGNFPLGEKRFWIADDELVKQTRNVLRLLPGEKIILSDGMGNEAEAEIISYDKGALEVKILDRKEKAEESLVKIVLYLAILKKENFELAVQKCVELGVSKIVPLITRRTVKLGIKKDRLEKIIKEAAEQSGRSMLAELGEEMDFRTALSDAQSNGINLFFSLGQKSAWPQKSKMSKSIGIFIGPEGGWDPQEIETARTAKLNLVGLGQFTLRAETAAIVALYAAQGQYGIIKS